MDIYPEIGLVAAIIAAAAVALSPLILGLVALRQSRKKTGTKWVRIGFPLAVVLDWLFLVAFFVATSPNYRKHAGISVHIADVFVLVSLALFIGVICRSANKVKLSMSMFLLLAVWTWAEQTIGLRTDGSALSVGISMVRDRIGCPPGDWDTEVLHKMAVYAKRGHPDAAIYAGRIWTEEHPQVLLHENAFIYMTWLYLDKARKDAAHADEYVREYREKTLEADQISEYSPATLGNLAALTEAAGDISDKERCLQYRSAIKLFKEKQDEISRRIVRAKADFMVEEVKSVYDETQADITRVREKQQKYACKE